MPLTDKQRGRYAARGLEDEEIDELESILDAEDGDADNGDKPSGSKRVLVIEGEDVEPFLERFFGGEDKPKKKKKAEPDEDADDEPAGGPKWFRK